MLLLAGGCGEDEEAVATAGLTKLTEWFEVASAGGRGDEHCHAFGLLKHQDATCADMLEHASRVVPEERRVTATRFRDCVQTVCGDFFEVELSGIDTGGRDITEIAVLKRDEGQFRLYWYRTTSLIDELARSAEANAAAEDEDAEIDAAYARITNAHSEFYQFPPCRGVRVSSSNKVGDLVATDALTVADFEARAARCPNEFCITFVGRKVAGVCP